MKNYYYLATSLPELQIGYPPDLSFQALELVLRDNLNAEDLAKVKTMRMFWDIRNIRSFWIGEQGLDPRGNYDEIELDEALLTRAGLPSYIYEFMDKYDSKESRLSHFSELISSFFNHEIEKAEGFLKQYLTFEREWRLVLTGFRAKQLNRDVIEELQYEDPYNEVVAQIIAQKDAKNYEPPTNYEDLKGIFDEHYHNPLKLHQALCEYRFQKLEEMYGIHIFEIGRILAYVAQLNIVEKWLELDKKIGLQYVDKIVKEAS